jgi:uncharacterized small protein (TIGR04563 family)
MLDGSGTQGGSVGEQNDAPVTPRRDEATPDSKTGKGKASLHFPEWMLDEMREEATRLDRSLSWVVRRAWRISRQDIKKLPGMNDLATGDYTQP